MRGPGLGPGGQVTSHWSAPPRNAGYRSGQTGHGDGWPERGGAGPQPGQHITGLGPRSNADEAVARAPRRRASWPALLRPGNWNAGRLRGPVAR